MKNYLLSIYSPDGNPPPPEILDPIMRDIRAVEDEMKAAGAWVFSGGLGAPSTVLRHQTDGGGMLVTDGPYIEGKEHLGGFTIVRAPDFDAAVQWGRKLAAALKLLPIEVRPFEGEA
jgi:hypothetical protein